MLTLYLGTSAIDPLPELAKFAAEFLWVDSYFESGLGTNAVGKTPAAPDLPFMVRGLGEGEVCPGTCSSPFLY
ncbi:Uncharacterised protein [Mycobacteroides abscessus subsp. abscessus]|nr:Uncharacterised protein [Mycobacteroides abscessus subsp. abscessus]